MKTLLIKIKSLFKRWYGCKCPCYTADKIEIKKNFRKKPIVKGTNAKALKKQKRK